VFTVHRKEVLEFRRRAYEIMTNHPEIIRNLKMHSTAAIGLTFEPYHPKKAPHGQIELDELPALPFLSEDRVGRPANDNEFEAVLDYLKAS
jgi:hypothetical protein